MIGLDPRIQQIPLLDAHVVENRPMNGLDVKSTIVLKIGGYNPYK